MRIRILILIIIMNTMETSSAVSSTEVGAYSCVEQNRSIRVYLASWVASRIIVFTQSVHNVHHISCHPIY